MRSRSLSDPDSSFDREDAGARNEKHLSFLWSISPSPRFVYNPHSIAQCTPPFNIFNLPLFIPLIIAVPIFCRVLTQEVAAIVMLVFLVVPMSSLCVLSCTHPLVCTATNIYADAELDAVGGERTLKLRYIWPPWSSPKLAWSTATTWEHGVRISTHE